MKKSDYIEAIRVAMVGGACSGAIKAALKAGSLEEFLKHPEAERWLAWFICKYPFSVKLKMDMADTLTNELFISYVARWSDLPKEYCMRLTDKLINEDRIGEAICYSDLPEGFKDKLRMKLK